MRIACVHVPQFALQSLTRIDPSLRGAAVAVVGAGSDPGGSTRTRGALGLHSPIVLACSRAAWAAGVRLGMTATAARFVSSDLRIVTADAVIERETVRGLADALLAIAPVVDVGGRVGAGGAHLAMYCEVPSRTRGTSFGDRVLELLEEVGITARIGIADDRFTAWVAAAHGGHDHKSAERRTRSSAEGDAQVSVRSAERRTRGSAEGGAEVHDAGVISVPRGGSAAFLAPRPLSLLAITPEVQHMLEALGVRTLGEFAALPAPSIAPRGARPVEADFQALARGESGNLLRPYAPEAPIREEIAVGAGGNLFGGAEAAAMLADRIALRLAGRSRGAARLEVAIVGDTGERVVPIVPVMAGHVIASGDDLTELIAPLLHEAPGAISKLRVVVTGEALAGDSDAVPADLPASPAVDTLSVVLATAGSSELHVARHALPATAPAARRDEDRSGPWQLTAPVLDADRRYRRTRRGKQRRRTGSFAVTASEPGLFGRVDRGR